MHHQAVLLTGPRQSSVPCLSVSLNNSECMSSHRPTKRNIHTLHFYHLPPWLVFSVCYIHTCITHQFSSTVPQLTVKEAASWHLQCTAFLRQSPSQVSPWLVGPWAKGGRYQMQPALLHRLCEAATATKRTGKYMHS